VGVVAVLGLSAIDRMCFITAYPFWSLMITAVDVAALYALCAYGSRENLAAWHCGPRTGHDRLPGVQ
jgi:hypothetical protein